jgi:hypothetical protein
MTCYFIVPAPGHYGSRAKVISSHRTVEAARKAKGDSAVYVIREGHKRKGDVWLRVFEGSLYPVVSD